jgi:hypothetical protein
MYTANKHENPKIVQRDAGEGNTGRSRLSRELRELEEEVNTSKLSQEDFELE